jgi:putative hydrolase of the HAD superfamily
MGYTENMGNFGRGGDTSIKAVGFDLDGTLYPNYRLYGRLIPRVLRHPRFYRAFVEARHVLHRREEAVPSLYGEQAALMAAALGEDPAAVRQKAERLIYRGWEGLFSGIRLFPQVKETLAVFRRAGLRLAVLSDFPPVRKISLLGLDGCFDVLLAAEETGSLKPSPVPFTALARALSLPPESILYVGNSARYDAAGARRTGMKTALIRRSPFSTGFSGAGRADFVFRDYRQLRVYVLG